MSRYSGRLRWVLVFLILLGIGWWLYVGPLAPEPKVRGDQTPRAMSVTPRCFKLWELHPEETVRIVEILTESSAVEEEVRIYGPALRDTDAIVTFTALGGTLSKGPTMRPETYRGKRYVRPEYVLSVSSDRYGYDLQAAHPPYLHVNGALRTFSLGMDPDTSCIQDIVAVAIPSEARIQSLYDYRPYRQVTLDGWDVYYYDIGDITKHISIHIRYRPAGDLPVLDWEMVEAQR